MEINIQEFVDSIFTQEELDAYNCITPTAMDINKLKETGNVTVVRTEENDMVQETIDYISHDGKTAFTKVQSYYTKDAYMHKLQQLNELKQAAVIRQDFELAAKYRDEAKALEDAQPNEAK